MVSGRGWGGMLICQSPLVTVMETSTVSIGCYPSGQLSLLDLLRLYM